MGRPSPDEKPRLRVIVSEHLPDRFPVPGLSLTLMPVLNDVAEERLRQDEKWGSQRTLTPEVWLRILAEEFGEAAKAINEGNYDPMDKDCYRREMIQVAAVAIAAVEAHDHRLALSAQASTQPG